MISARLSKFLLVGGVGAIAYIFGSTFLTFLGIVSWASSVITYICLTPIIYSIQKKFVFKSNLTHAKSFLRYLTIQCIGIGSSAAVPYVLDMFAIDPIVSFVCVVFLTSLVSYSLQLNWAFRMGDS
jgi:putative flippase GtrA